MEGVYNSVKGGGIGTTRRLIPVTLLYNVGFWVYFWSDFAIQALPYREHRPVFEEILPLYVVFNRAVPFPDDYYRFSVQLAHWVQAPCFWLMVPITKLLNWMGPTSGPTLWDRTFFGTSPGGYQLIGVTFLSFLQWLAVATLGLWLYGKFRVGIRHRRSRRTKTV